MPSLVSRTIQLQSRLVRIRRLRSLLFLMSCIRHSSRTNVYFATDVNKRYFVPDKTHMHSRYNCLFIQIDTVQTTLAVAADCAAAIGSA